MGWFDEQIKERKKHDQEVFEEAFADISSSVTGEKISSAFADDGARAKSAIDEILNFYHVKTRDVPDGVKDVNEQLEYLMRPYGIMRRTVLLEKRWHKDAMGAMLGVKKGGGVVALLPAGLSGYRFYDEEKGKYVKVNRKTEEIFEREAIAFYKPFPLRKISIGMLLKYIVGILSVSDFVFIGLATLFATLVGMLLPKLNQLLFGLVVGSNDIALLVSIAVFMVSVSVTALLINAVKSLLMARITTKMDVTVQAATMARILSLPADFFKKYSSGELSSRAEYINELCTTIVDSVLSTSLTSLFSLLYISQIFVYAPALVIPAVSIIAVTLVFSVLSAFVQMRLRRKVMHHEAKERGLGYALITGVQKIKLSGSEKRAFANWGRHYAEPCHLIYGAPPFITFNSALGLLISLVGAFVMFFFAVESGVSVADYYAFDSAYGMVSGAFMSLSSIALTFANIKPILEMAKPIMEAVPEIAEGKQVLSRISGGIELNNVFFRYSDDMPYVVDDLSLKIKPGQYVAIVGATGCGKSTLMRLMLGFETPQKGAIYYDGKDLSTIDLKSLRRKVGTVMQNGKLFSGDIYSNIVISAPWLSLDEAWEAAELSGVAEDIRRMPMGMHTVISEGSGGISGGQRQRLMIARAIAPKPRILMFDEATSALDNLTQKQVSDALASLKCTRIVIAHRLSTIRQCDRILYLEGGKIVEDGTYDALIEKNGKFAELVSRQRLDVGE